MAFKRSRVRSPSSPPPNSTETMRFSVLFFLLSRWYNNGQRFLYDEGCYDAEKNCVGLCVCAAQCCDLRLHAADGLPHFRRRRHFINIGILTYLAREINKYFKIVFRFYLRINIIVIFKVYYVIVTMNIVIPSNINDINIFIYNGCCNGW